MRNKRQCGTPRQEVVGVFADTLQVLHPPPRRDRVRVLLHPVLAHELVPVPGLPVAPVADVRVQDGVVRDLLTKRADALILVYHSSVSIGVLLFFERSGSVQGVS